MTFSNWVSIDFGAATIKSAMQTEAGIPKAVRLDAHGYPMSSALYIASPIQIEVGPVAIEAAATDPSRLVSGLKLWIAEGRNAIEVAGMRIPVRELASVSLHGALSRIQRETGRAPAGLVLTHPPAWRPEQLRMLIDAAQENGYGRDMLGLVPESAAAAVQFAQTRNLPSGTRFAVLDFGASHFTVTVLAIASDGEFTVVAGRTDPGLGGDTIDTAVRRWVDTELARRNRIPLAALEPGTPGLNLANEAIRKAKEQLSQVDSADIVVRAGGYCEPLTLDRGTLTGLIAPEIARAAQLVHTTLDAASIADPADLAALYVIGGTAHIPALLHELGRFGGISYPDDADIAIALGALRALGSNIEAGSIPDTGLAAQSSSELTSLPPVTPSATYEPTPPPVSSAVPEAMPLVLERPDWAAAPVPTDRGIRGNSQSRARRSRWVLLTLAAAMAVLVVALVLVNGRHHASARATVVRNSLFHNGIPDVLGELAVDDADHTVYMTDPSNANGVVMVDTRTKSVRGSLPIPSAIGVAVDPVEHRVYVSSKDPCQLTTVDATNNTITASLPMTGASCPRRLAIDPRDHLLYIQRLGGVQHEGIDVFDTATNTAAGIIAVDNDDGAIAFNPYTHLAYAQSGPDGVAVIDTATSTVKTTIHIGAHAGSIAVDPDTGKAYVTNDYTDHGSHEPGPAVSVIDTQTGTVTSTIRIDRLVQHGGGVTDIAVDPGTHTAYAACLDSVTMIDSGTGKAIGDISTPLSIASLAIDSVSHLVYANGEGLTILGP